MPTKKELLQNYGPEIGHFTHEIKRVLGTSEEEFVIRKRTATIKDGCGLMVELNLVDKEGRRVAMNTHTQKDRQIHSVIMWTNYDEKARLLVGVHNTGMSNPYRIVPGSAAALIAHYMVLQKGNIDAWYSSGEYLLSGESINEPHTGLHLYAHTLNKHFGNLVTSRRDGDRYMVTAN